MRAIVTGANGGIGSAIVKVFREHDVEVIGVNRNDFNLMNNEEIRKFMSKIGDVDILINCAGMNDLAGIEEMTDEKINEVIQVNLISQMTLIKCVTPGMKKNKYGRIVNLASIWCRFSKERRVMYSVAKAGVVGLTVASAVELSKYNILTNAVAPSFVNTVMTSKNNTPEQIAAIAESLPIKRMAEPDEIARAVWFLASPDNTFITGQTIFVDGGFSCI